MEDLARKYARAAYEAALESWLGQLGTVRQALVAHPDVIEMLNSDANFSERQRALDAVLPGDVNKGVRNFLYMLLREHRLDLLDGIIVELGYIIRRGPEARVARVVSAVPLTDEERERVQAWAIKRFGGDLEFDFQVDPKILGGVIIKVGDEVLDGSLASRLTSMRAQLLKSP
ncbi:MAG: ATP synthase F1 subunit delta [Anaerolineae bacterium]|nr:ATP synthase F1 subunit delta [Anaerolineae bacterium]